MSESGKPSDGRTAPTTGSHGPLAGAANTPQRSSSDTDASNPNGATTPLTVTAANGQRGTSAVPQAHVSRSTSHLVHESLPSNSRSVSGGVGRGGSGEAASLPHDSLHSPPTLQQARPRPLVRRRRNSPGAERRLMVGQAKEIKVSVGHSSRL